MCITDSRMRHCTHARLSSCLPVTSLVWPHPYCSAVGWWFSPVVRTASLAASTAAINSRCFKEDNLLCKHSSAQSISRRQMHVSMHWCADHRADSWHSPEICSLSLLVIPLSFHGENEVMVTFIFWKNRLSSLRFQSTVARALRDVFESNRDFCLCRITEHSCESKKH